MYIIHQPGKWQFVRPQQGWQFMMGPVGELQIIPDTLQPDCVEKIQEGRIFPMFVLRMI